LDQLVRTGCQNPREIASLSESHVLCASKK
jgi:hypothetical protein